MTLGANIKFTQQLSTAEREAKAKEMGVVVPLGLRSTTARKAYLNLRNVPTYRVIKVRKQKTRVITEIVEKKVPRKTVVRGIASAGYSLRPMRTKPILTSFPIRSATRAAIC